MTSHFDGKHALVTGGTSGIGAAIARGLADAGCKVIVTGLTADEADRFCRNHKDISACVVDVADQDSIDCLIAGFDRLDILVNCAGMFFCGGAELDLENFERVIDVNLMGTMRVCTACRPLLAGQGGCIVNTASMLSFFGSGFVPAYSASKGGIVQLTKSLAIAWAGQNIRVNAVAPGWIETPLTQPLVDDAIRRKAIVDRTPMGRWGQPADLVGPVLFLCSSAAAFITGAICPSMEVIPSPDLWYDSTIRRVSGSTMNHRGACMSSITIPHPTTPPDAVPEIVTQAIPADERVWVPQAKNVWFRPLMLNTVNGGWCNLLRVRKSGVLSRHRHPAPVHGYVIKGSWRYLEHDWVATEGSYVFEPPGETHTLVVDEGVDEMITFFNISGAMIYLDEHDNHVGYEDVHTKIEMCRRHYREVGLGDKFLEQFIR